ncbi:MAG: hypothetical protein JF571_04450 [Asticcacaulis sp.]|nr:hypothetical protein [Asticcacaulis sp.]
MTVMKSGLAVLAVGALMAGPLSAQPAQSQHFACTYYDFNHEVQYSSKVFASAQGNSDASAYLGDFSRAIHAQFRIPVEAKHVECHTVGDWRLDTERERVQQLTATRDGNDRVVDWPRAAS